MNISGTTKSDMACVAPRDVRGAGQRRALDESGLAGRWQGDARGQSNSAMALLVMVEAWS
jgi:hypothetical protein